jgi:hypothetical protein
VTNPHRALAIAVLRLAIKDACGQIEATHVHRGQGAARTYRAGQRGKATTREQIEADAYDWLTTESESLAFWCELAGIDMDTVLEGADGAIEAWKARGTRMKQR